MGLDALERSALEQAQTEAQQAKTAADKAKTSAQAINAPVNQGSAAAKQAVKKAFDAADDAKAAADKAKNLADQYQAKLDESIKDATAAAKKATKAQHDAEVARDAVKDDLRRKTEALEHAKSLAEETARRAATAAVPAGMTDKLARLKSVETDLTQKRDDAQTALEAAKAEITKAKEAFAAEKRAADETVRCQQGALSKMWYGPTVTEKELEAQRAVDKATADLKDPDEKFKALEKEVTRAATDREDYGKTVAAKSKLKGEADKEAKQAADAHQDLDREVKTLNGELARLDPKLTTANTLKAAKDKELVALQKLQDVRPDAAAALLAANQARQKGLDVCDSLNLVTERLDADIDTGAVFQNLTAAEKLALDDFNGGGRGAAAKRLGPALNNLSEADFLTKMGTETPVPTISNIGSPKGGQQAMKKWEYPDGTVVRYKPDGDDKSAGLATYSIEVKVDVAWPDHNPGDIAFKVDPAGRAVPKGPDDVNNPYPGPPKKKAYREQVMKLGHRSLA